MSNLTKTQENNLRWAHQNAESLSDPDGPNGGWQDDLAAVCETGSTIMYLLEQAFPFLAEGDKMSDLLAGDEIYWNDPDEGVCSGHGTFVKHLNDEAVLIRKDGVEIEVSHKELS